MDVHSHYPCEKCGWLITDDTPACPRCGGEHVRWRLDYYSGGIALIVAALLVFYFLVLA